ncbi:SPOSA6832_01118, partial [Sporobolomyces salmonicolor]
MTAARLGIDNLHVGLLQVVLLLVLRSLLDVVPNPFKRKSIRAATASTAAPPAIEVVVAAAPQSATAAVPTILRQRHTRPRRSKRTAALPSSPPSLFPAAKLDSTVADFLSATEPAFLAHLPDAQPTTSIPPLSLSSWTNVYSQDAISVLQHPSVKTLYGISAIFPDVPLRKLYETLVDIGTRSTWDSMTQGADEVERFEVQGRRGNVSHMRMKGMPMVKAKHPTHLSAFAQDLVLLSVAGRLPIASDHPAPALPVADKLRIYCATTSVEHPKVPPTSAFNRMEVIFRTVTQTMLPKSLVKLGAAAAASTKETDYWPPPLLGHTQTTPSSSTSPASPSSEDESGSEDDLSASGDENEDATSTPSPTFPAGATPAAPLSPSASRDLHALVAQLRSLTSRLSALESLVTPSAASPSPSPSPSSSSSRSFSSSSSSATARPWYSFDWSEKPAGPPAAADAGAETMTLSAGRLSALATIGSAAGAAIAVAAVTAWSRRRH